MARATPGSKMLTDRAVFRKIVSGDGKGLKMSTPDLKVVAPDLKVSTPEFKMMT